MSSFFGNPVVAAILGLAFGVALVLASKVSFRLVNPESRYVGLAAAAVALILRMAIAAGVMFAYLAYFRTGFAAFAVATLAGFFALYGVELVRYGRLKRLLGRGKAKGSR